MIRSARASRCFVLCSSHVKLVVIAAVGLAMHISITARAYVTVDSSFNPSLTGGVASVAIQADGRILLGGNFTTLGGQSRTNLARLHSNGTGDSSFNPALGNSVYSIHILNDNRILLGSSVVGAVRLNSSGTQDGGFTVGGSLPVLEADGRMLVFGGGYRPVLRLDTDGNFIAAFLVPGWDSKDDEAYCLAVQADGKILVGGDFGIARLNANGTPDSSFQPQWIERVVVFCEQADGKILIVGRFVVAGSQIVQNWARLNTDGTTDSTFNPVIITGLGGVSAIAVQSDGKILIGGTFTIPGDSVRTNLARLNLDGTLDATLDVEVNGWVSSIAVQSDGKVLLAGRFTSVGGAPHNGIARLNTTQPATETLLREDSAVTWLRGGSSPEVLRTTFEHSPNGVTWSPMGVGVRYPGGWRLDGINVPKEGVVRVRGHVFSGQNEDSGSGWFVESTIPCPDLINSTPILIPDHGTADPSPSSIFVSGIPSNVSKVIVTLWGLSHTYAADVGVLLVGPSGQGVVLMSATGGASDLSDVTLAFDDEAESFLPDEGSILSGVFKPTNLYGTNHYFGQSAPPPPYAKTLSVFNGTNPNGQWRLYVFDNKEEDSGVIAGGWSLDFGNDSPPQDLDLSALDKWHVRFSSPTNYSIGVTAYPGGFAAVTLSGDIITSPEGLDWTQRATSTNLPLWDVTFGSGTLVAVGALGIIQTSSNGNAWVRRYSATNNKLNDVTYGGGKRFVAVGEAGTIQISLNAGSNWQTASSGTVRPLNGVAYGRGRFVAVGGDGVIVVSTNGLNWTPAVGVTNVTLRAVTYGAGKFVAVGDSRLILTSFDGVRWARQSGPVFNNTSLFDVIHANRQFVCVGTLGTVLTSSDGWTWTSRAFPTTPFAPDINSIAFNGDTFVVACGYTGPYQSDPVTLSPPRIVHTPRDTTVRLGGTTNLSVTVTGTSPFRYLWQQEDTLLAGATNRLLVFSNTQVSAEARYTVTVENALGKITSLPVWLRVGVPPSFILQPQNQEVVPGGDATFSVQVAGTSPFDFHWRQPSSSQPGFIYAIRHDPGQQSFWSVHRVEPAQANGALVS